MRLFFRESLACYSGTGRTLSQQNRLKIYQIINSCGYSMLHLGPYLHRDGNDSKCMTTLSELEIVREEDRIILRPPDLGLIRQPVKSRSRLYVGA